MPSAVNPLAVAPEGANMTDPNRDELARRLDDLERAIAELREDLTAGESREGRPPTRETARRLADEFAVPAIDAALEANIRSLELLRELIRSTDRGRRTPSDDRDPLSGTVRRFERTLEEIEAALEGSTLPRNADARGLLTEARRLNEAISERLDPSDRVGDEPDDETVVRIDVESELESIKDELDDEDDES